MGYSKEIALARLTLLAASWKPAALLPDGADLAVPDSLEMATDDECATDDCSGVDEDPEPRQATTPVFPRRSVAALGLVAVCALVGWGAWVWWTAPRELSPSPSAEPPPVVAVESANPVVGGFGAPEAGPVVVHVAGKVRHPGLFTLAPGARVADALAAAGGLARGESLGSTNLAREVSDGERIDVGAQQGGATGSGGAAAGPLDLNQATAEQLDTLPGVGPVTAAKILTWRTSHGRFTTVEELAEVPGIGPKTLADLKPLVRV